MLTEEEKKELECRPKDVKRYQAKVWSDTVLSAILSGVLFEFEGSIYHSHAILDNARQVGCYFSGFAGAFDTWMKNPNSFNENVLKKQAEEVFLALPVPYDHPDICYEMDAVEERIVELERENKELKAEVSRLQDLGHSEEKP